MPLRRLPSGFGRLATLSPPSSSCLSWTALRRIFAVHYLGDGGHADSRLSNGVLTIDRQHSYDYVSIHVDLSCGQKRELVRCLSQVFASRWPKTRGARIIGDNALFFSHVQQTTCATPNHDRPPMSFVNQRRHCRNKLVGVTLRTRRA
jgi:hypothetical protein